MGRFQTEFRSVDEPTKQQLHAEAWTTYAAVVERAMQSGKDRMTAERDALAETRKQLNPELDEKTSALRVVQP